MPPKRPAPKRSAPPPKDPAPRPLRKHYKKSGPKLIRQRSAALEKWLSLNPLRRWLDRQPWGTGKTLAEAMGITRQGLNEYLVGRTEPRLRRMRAITRATGITADEWIEWMDLEPPPPPKKWSTPPTPKRNPLLPRR